MMTAIRGSNTLPELRLRSALHRLGFRFRLHGRKLPGRPDIVFPRYHAVVFVHGCFWHRHRQCKLTSTPSTRPEFWATKFEANVARDKRNLASLKKLGWRAFVVWECEIRGDLSLSADKVADWLEALPSVR